MEAKCETALQYYKKVATTGGCNILIKLGICNMKIINILRLQVPSEDCNNSNEC